MRARVTGMDLLTLELHAALAARLDASAAADTPEDAAEDEDGAEPAGTLKLAIELDDPATPLAAAAADPA